jgi:hypothetical protein
MARSGHLLLVLAFKVGIVSPPALISRKMGHETSARSNRCAIEKSSIFRSIAVFSANYPVPQKHRITVPETENPLNCGFSSEPPGIRTRNTVLKRLWQSVPLFLVFLIPLFLPVFFPGLRSDPTIPTLFESLRPTIVLLSHPSFSRLPSASTG